MTRNRAASNRWCSLAQNILLSAASTVIFLGMLEGGARCVGQRPCLDFIQQTEDATSKVRPHALRQYDLVPGSVFTFDREAAIRHGLSAEYLDIWERITYRINSLGIRGEEVSTAKAADTFRILLLGDSVAFGWGLEEQDSLSYQLQQCLNQSGIDKHVEVWNCGVPGYATWQELSYLVEKGSTFHPDMVLIPFLFNDVDGNNEAARNYPFGMGTVGQIVAGLTHKSALVCFLRNLALEFRLKRLHGCLGPNCWDATKTALDSLVAQSNKLGSRLVLVAMPMRRQVEPGAEPGYYDRALGENPRANYQDIIANLCHERGIVYLDLLPTFQQAMAQRQRTLFLNADHPNAEGSRLTAEAICLFLRQLLVE